MSEKNTKATDTIECTLTSPEKTETYAGLRSITIPALSGFMEILPGHAEAFVLLRGGTAALRHADDRIEAVSLSGGQCHVRNNKVLIIG